MRSRRFVLFTLLAVGLAAMTASWGMQEYILVLNPSIPHNDYWVSAEPTGARIVCSDPLLYGFLGWFLEGSCAAPKNPNHPFSCAGHACKAYLPYRDEYMAHHLLFGMEPYGVYCTQITQSDIDGKVAETKGTGRFQWDQNGVCLDMGVLTTYAIPFIKYYVTNFCQKEYEDLYGDHGQSTIHKLGCFLCCTCNSLNAIGITTNPPELNSYLRTHHGYDGVLVNLAAVKRFCANVYSCRIGIKDKSSNVPIHELMARIFVWPWAHANSGHWVSIVSCMKWDGSGAIILDPMDRSTVMPFGSKYGSLGGSGRAIYGGWAPPGSAAMSGHTMSTPAGTAATPTAISTCQQLALRGFERVRQRMTALQDPSQTQAQSTIIDSGIGVYHDEFPTGNAEMQWDGSHITAWAESSNVTLHLIHNGKEVAVSEPEVIEDGETEELTDAGTSLGITNQPAGSYVLRITGAPGTPYVGNIKGDSYWAEELGVLPISGTLPESGVAEVAFRFACDAWCDDLAPIGDAPDGTSIVVSKAVCTAVVPGGFWAQPMEYKVPAVFVSYAGTDAQALCSVYNIEGTVTTDGQGNKIIEAISVDFWPGDDWLKKPMVVPAARVQTTHHVLIDMVGQYQGTWENGITVDGVNVQIDNGLEALEIPEGRTIAVKGVYHTDGVFYCKDAAYVRWGDSNGPWEGGQQSLALSTAISAQRTTSSAVARVRPPASTDCAEWATQQPDGTAVSLVAEAVLEVSEAGTILGDRWTLAGPTIRLLGNVDVRQWNTVDVQGVLTTLTDGIRAVVPSGVQVYTDARGKPFAFPTPPVRGVSSQLISNWAHRTEVVIRL